MTDEGPRHHEIPPMRKRRLRKPRPVCPVHGYEMWAGSSPPGIRYCYCPVDGCAESRQEARDD